MQRGVFGEMLLLGEFGEPEVEDVVASDSRAGQYSFQLKSLEVTNF